MKARALLNLNISRAADSVKHDGDSGRGMLFWVVGFKDWLEDLWYYVPYPSAFFGGADQYCLRVVVPFPDSGKLLPAAAPSCRHCQVEAVPFQIKMLSFYQFLHDLGY
ncbi:hypothetical protein ES703_88890 [subsurface metagenome]